MWNPRGDSLPVTPAASPRPRRAPLPPRPKVSSSSHQLQKEGGRQAGGRAGSWSLSAGSALAARRAGGLPACLARLRLVGLSVGAGRKGGSSRLPHLRQLMASHGTTLPEVVWLAGWQADGAAPFFSCPAPGLRRPLLVQSQAVTVGGEAAATDRGGQGRPARQWVGSAEEAGFLVKDTRAGRVKGRWGPARGLAAECIRNYARDHCLGGFFFKKEAKDASKHVQSALLRNCTRTILVGFKGRTFK